MPEATDPTDVANIQRMIGSRSETSDRAGLNRGLGPNNVTIAPGNVGSMHKGSVVIPTEARHVHSSVRGLLHGIQYVLDLYFPPGWRTILSKDYFQPVHQKFKEFEVSLHDR